MALSLLLQYGGDFTIPDTHGRAPIHWAVTTPNTDCLQVYIVFNECVQHKTGIQYIVFSEDVQHKTWP